MAKLFGFSIEGADDNNLPQGAVSPVPQNDADKSDYYVSSGFYGQYVDIEGVFRNEYDLIKRYSCLLYTSPSPRDKRQSRMPSSA